MSRMMVGILVYLSTTSPTSPDHSGLTGPFHRFSFPGEGTDDAADVALRARGASG